MVTIPLEIWADLQEDLGIDTALLRAFTPIWFLTDDDCKPETWANETMSGSGFYCEWNFGWDMNRVTGCTWFYDNESGISSYFEGYGDGSDNNWPTGDGR